MRRRIAGLMITANMALATATAHAACPQWDPQSERMAELRAQVLVAENESTGRVLSRRMWEIWATAPDETAQELLNSGMQARESYDYDRAMAAFEALVAYCPDYAEGYNQRAFVNFLRQNYAPAIVDLERTLEINPGHIAAKSGLALTLLQMGRIEAGQAVLREAVEMNPWLPERGYLNPSQEN